MSENLIKSKFIIRYSDMFSQDNYEIVIGNKKVDFETKEMVYNYESKLGNCVLKYYRDTVNISRKGQSPLDLSVTLNKETDFVYSNEVFSQSLFVKGQAISIHSEKNQSDENPYANQTLTFSYEIFQKNENKNEIEINIINKITISITEI